MRRRRAIEPTLVSRGETDDAARLQQRSTWTASRGARTVRIEHVHGAPDGVWYRVHRHDETLLTPPREVTKADFAEALRVADEVLNAAPEAS